METNYLHYKQEIQVSVNDVDFSERLKPSAIMGYFQDIATEHAVVLGIGYAEMKTQNLVWVMSRMSYIVSRYPLIGEKLTIVTCPEKPKTAEVNRGYYIYDAAGKIVVKGSSKWCVIDSITRRVQRCAPLFRFEDAVYIPYQPFDDANLRIGGITENDAPRGPIPYAVQVTDLDRNLHMNNAKYGDVFLNACGIAPLKTQNITRLDVNFISELFCGDRYDVFLAVREGRTVAEARKDGDAVVFRICAEWAGIGG